MFAGRNEKLFKNPRGPYQAVVELSILNDPPKTKKRPLCANVINKIYIRVPMIC